MGIWKIKVAEDGIFEVDNPHKIDNLYFPLTNTEGSIFSCISPLLSGDIKVSVNSYLTYPVTVYDLKNMFCIRTMWLRFSSGEVINISPFFSPTVSTKLIAGPLYHHLFINKGNIQAEVINFVPEGLSVEVMRIKLKNLGVDSNIEAVFSLPLFCRSVDNLFDHRHVTSLLVRAYRNKWGIEVKPTMCFDERGHKKNEVVYFVYGFRDDGNHPQEVIVALEEFVGEEGNLLRPEYIFSRQKKNFPSVVAGKEPFCGLNFGEVALKKKEEVEFFIVMGITDKEPAIIFTKLSTPSQIDEQFKKSKSTWRKIYNCFELITNNIEFDFWFKWVSVQPVLRRLFGCSFLPHFDYGRGGRGWRDLWQDIFVALLVSPEKVKQELVNNFKGVRIDGSNATIIDKKGGFISDRNRIVRVWMDHGVWPYLALKLYLNQTEDWDVLFEKIEFFRDHQLKRGKEVDGSFGQKEKDNILRDQKGEVYTSSLFEHFLIQNLVAFFNVGDHGNIRLENADWNDGLDMAPSKGESVTFSFMYASNLKDMAELLSELKKRRGMESIELTEEVLMLIDTATQPIDYSNINERRSLLEEYFEQTKQQVKGKKVNIQVDILIKDLKRKAEWMFNHLRRSEWLDEVGIFNGYYDDKGKRVEGKIKGQIRVMLPSQVFSMMSGVADGYHCKRIYQAICQYLQEPVYKTFRLNTDFKELKLDLGRAFGFSYGDKENGAIFSHMEVMLAFSLYQQGAVKEGWSLLKSLFRLATSKESKVYPCLPEYFNMDYRGMYSYLTGSASWLVLLVVTQMFGVKRIWGDLFIEPKLVLEQFSANSQISLGMVVEGKFCFFHFVNNTGKDWPEYCIKEVVVNGEMFFQGESKKVKIPRNIIKRLFCKDREFSQVRVILA